MLHPKHIKADGKVTLWDLGPPKDDDGRAAWEKRTGPHQVELWAVDAVHALTIESERFVHALPKGVKAGPAQAVVEQVREAAGQSGGQADPHYGDQRR